MTYSLVKEPLAKSSNRSRDEIAFRITFANEKYSGEQKEIEIVLRAHEAKAALTVCDRGLGVPSGLEEKIFEKFFRAHDSLASGIQGTGLGLTLARQIALAHSGDVTYKSREGGGSCFTLELPLLNHNPGIARPNA